MALTPTKPAPNPQVADRFSHFGQSIFAEYSTLAAAHNAVNLSQGFPDFDGPAHVKEAAIAAIRAGQAQYAPMTGIPPLRRAIASMWEGRGFGPVDADAEVTVTCGCSEALTCVFAGLLNPGDEVIIFEPFFDYYAAGLAWSGATGRFVTLHAPARDGEPFRFDEQQLRRAFTPRTRAIILNTPHNPTGKVFTRAELELIASLCTEHNVVCVSDEVYEHLIFEPGLPHIPIATLPGMRDLTITLSSLGKTFSLTGWKVGWAIAPPHLSAAVRAAHQFNSFSGCVVTQHGAVAALNAPGAYARDLCGLFRRNRDALGDALRRAGLVVHRSDSTYFLMADHTPVSRRLGLDPARGDRAFCEYLTKEVGVAAIPPSVFYETKELGRTLARFAFCKKIETINEACRRLERLQA
ncbi:MAG: aminotransferase class I/II-fold pyridoxal phosphate-dependent enzyme [Phycisphaerales bacterium]